MDTSSLYYESSGSGEPLLLIHAGIADSRMWDEQVQAFSARYRVIRFDAQGFGRSAAVKDPLTRADDIHSLLNSLEIYRAHLVGVSMGGAAAVDFAVCHPEMVGALVPVAAGLSGFDPSDPNANVWMNEREARQEVLLEAGDLDAVTQIDLEIWLAGPSRRVEDMPAGLTAQVRTMARHANARQPERSRTPQIDPPAFARLDRVTAPTLVLIGDGDVPYVLEVADVLSDRIPGATKRVFTDTTHMINMERPAEFNQAVLDFLAAHPLS